MSRKRKRGGAAEPRATFPAGFLPRMEALLGPETDAFAAALARPAAGLRVNTLRCAPGEFGGVSPFAVEALPGLPEGFLVSAAARAGAHPFHHAGLYYLQDPGAMYIAAMLGAEPGERVLDLAAAPGGKATHLAARMADRGVLVANDVDRARAQELAGNLERCGVRSAVVLSESVERLAGRFEGWFDRVLLDAPCSGESMFHKSDAARRDWSPAAVEGCARRQEDLLARAADLVRPGGVLGYSTCTFSGEENERVVARTLRARPDLELIDPWRPPGAERGRPGLAGEGEPVGGLERTVRLWPHRVPGAGHFFALFRRREGAAESAIAAARPEEIPGAVRRGIEELEREVLGPGVLPIERLVVQGSGIFASPDVATLLSGLRVVRPGWWVATLRGDRVEPEHALAMGIVPSEARRVLELDPGGGEAAAYVRGEVIRRADAPPGWTLVTVGGYPLGWAKGVPGRLQNHYPRGLRRG